MSIKIILNGKEEMLDNGTLLSDLLKLKNIRKEIVVSELNGEIVDKEKYEVTSLKDGDKLEFVYYMGGGDNGAI